MGGKEAFTSPPASRKRRVTPSIGKRKRRQEELTDQPRRSKRRQIYSDPTSIPVTPSAPSSSIRDTARISSVSGSGGSREYTGSTYSLEAVLSKRTLSSPHPGHADATEKPGDETAVSDGPRHCYCDEYCQACTSIVLLFRFGCTLANFCRQIWRECCLLQCKWWRLVHFCL